ncbi:uncharacterized protein AMSG_06259 [Thecamonas trahens ATCC 50062]|uniref:Right handed beta helix domain-containing protein n=1 Tax=Thecamonas trahens ATCC 50062 TaxID=461836 RepID=A0A0L0DCW1_THETB|nr:hypothetical protein AMSG_06259 [Thecamonas trahens ATCC 50062]KNC49951.1 hypothetical protein AMSG_06259 [Thecamonas trahens ATCC 50062]|eukprot:XP_013757428.1 hypothetical protein AMSG_06259 [Thecamonas trahens ATCC 50062]
MLKPLLVAMVVMVMVIGTATTPTTAATVTVSPTSYTVAEIQSVLSSVTAGTTVVVPSGTYTGCAISGPLSFPSFADNVVLQGAGLGRTIIDCSADNERIVMLANTGQNAIVEHMTLRGGSATDLAADRHGGCVEHSGSGSFVLRHLHLDGCSVGGSGSSIGYKGGAIHVGGSSAASRIEDVRITNSYAQTGGGALAHTSSTALTLERVVIEDCSAGIGGGLYIASTSSFFMIDSTVRRTTAVADGGGLYLKLSGTRDLSSVTVADCSAGGNGGGMSATTGNFLVNSIVLSGNTAVSGGGLSASAVSGTFTNAYVLGNVAVTGGGVHSFGSSSFGLVGAVISGNTASGGNGGGSLTDSILSHNVATGCGGGMTTSISGSTSSSSNVTFLANTASSNGGGLCALGAHTVDILPAFFTGNTAGNHGGGIYIAGPAVRTFDSAKLEGNVATNGSAVWFGAGSSSSLRNSLVTRNLATGVGAVYLEEDGSSFVDLDGSQVCGNYGPAPQLGLNIYCGTIGRLSGGTPPTGECHGTGLCAHGPDTCTFAFVPTSCSSCAAGWSGLECDVPENCAEVSVSGCLACAPQHGLVTETSARYGGCEHCASAGKIFVSTWQPCAAAPPPPPPPPLSCDVGYEPQAYDNGTTSCVDVDECAQASANCTGTGVVCINEEGSAGTNECTTARETRTADALISFNSPATSQYARVVNRRIVRSDDTVVTLPLHAKMVRGHSLVGILAVRASDPFNRSARVLSLALSLAVMLLTVALLLFADPASYASGSGWGADVLLNMLLSAVVGTTLSAVLGTSVIRWAMRSRSELLARFGFVAGLVLAGLLTGGIVVLFTLADQLPGYSLPFDKVLASWLVSIVISWLVTEPAMTAFKFLVFGEVFVRVTYIERMMSTAKVGPASELNAALESASAITSDMSDSAHSLPSSLG